ncbi:MAG: hypothetical protein K6A32_03225 [Bacteroidales bacterium]|nr:hypothetical protein [Bacteroidales bacterium]
MATKRQSALLAFSVLVMVLSGSVLIAACQGNKTGKNGKQKYDDIAVTFEARKASDEAMFANKLYASVNGKEQEIDIPDSLCIFIEAQQDFDGDGITDALVRNVQACGGNAVGDSFFFVSYDGKGLFHVSDNFGESVYEDPVIADTCGFTAVKIIDTEADFWGEIEKSTWKYILFDKQAVILSTPSEIHKMPKATAEEWTEVTNRLNEEGMVLVEDEEDVVPPSPEDSKVLEDDWVYDDMYSGKCSWYCGGEVQKVTASGCHAKEGETAFEPTFAHDFDHTQGWASQGEGPGEYLDYHFAGGCPRITQVKILNGDMRSEETWKSHSRSKQIKVLYRDKTYALLLLENTQTLQIFDIRTVGYNDPEAADWTLRFEIAETYPAKQHNYVVISELYFNGIDVH